MALVGEDPSSVGRSARGVAQEIIQIAYIVHPGDCRMELRLSSQPVELLMTSPWLENFIVYLAQEEGWRSEAYGTRRPLSRLGTRAL